MPRTEILGSSCKLRCFGRANIMLQWKGKGSNFTGSDIDLIQHFCSTISYVGSLGNAHLFLVQPSLRSITLEWVAMVVQLVGSDWFCPKDLNGRSCTTPLSYWLPQCISCKSWYTQYDYWTNDRLFFFCMLAPYGDRSGY